MWRSCGDTHGTGQFGHSVGNVFFSDLAVLSWLDWTLPLRGLGPGETLQRALWAAELLSVAPEVTSGANPTSESFVTEGQKSLELGRRRVDIC